MAIDPLNARIVVRAVSGVLFAWSFEEYRQVSEVWDWVPVESGTSGSLADATFMAMLAYMDILNRR